MAPIFRQTSTRSNPLSRCGEGNPATAESASPLLALPLALHVGKRGESTLLQSQLDALHEQIMDFAPLVEGDLPLRFIMDTGFHQLIFVLVTQPGELICCDYRDSAERLGFAARCASD
jgi:hypothetical protein